MALTVRTNIPALKSADHLGRTNRSLAKVTQRISSGLRVTSAADDAAGLGVATNLDTGEISTRQAIRNSNDGISLIQTAEGAANEVTDILQRMRELAVQSSSETLADSERAYIQDEFEQLSAEVARIATVTEFNGVSLADGTTTELDVQVGINNDAASRITIGLGDMTTTTLGVGTGTIAMDAVTSAQAAIDAIDTALDSVSGYRAGLGAVQNRIDSAINNSETYAESLSAASSQILDADMAHETSEMSRLQILQQAGVAALGQAKNMNQAVVNLLQG